MFRNYFILFLLLYSAVTLSAEPKDKKYIIEVKPDNNDNSLPPSFRSWYYKTFDGIDTSSMTRIEIIGDGWQGGEFVLPVYSYNNRHWQRFTRDEILTQPADSDKLYNYTLIKKFEKENVTIARYFPYDYERLERLEKRLAYHKNCGIMQIGKSSQGHPIHMYIITDNNVSLKHKKAIWIHARTHPSESGSSYIAEGIIDYILKKKQIDDVKIDLKKLVFYIVPIVNVDGVVEGNSRVTPVTSIDLEREWRFQYSEDKRKITDSAAIEVRVLNNTINRLIDEGNNFIMAINIHSTNSEPPVYPFIFTNFSRPLPEHGADGDSMFLYHLRIANLVNKFYCPPKVCVKTSYVPTKPMDLKTYPESWWWANFRSSVIAFTFETAATYKNCIGSAVTSTDNYLLGEAIAMAVQKYNDVYINKNYDDKFSEYNLIELMKNFSPNGE